MDEKGEGIVKFVGSVITGSILIVCLSANTEPSYLISPSTDRHIRFLYDASHEVLDAYIFYRGKDDRQIFMIDGLTFPTRPVIKYLKTRSEVLIMTGFYEETSSKKTRENFGTISYMKFIVENTWKYLAYDCEIVISYSNDRAILPIAHLAHINADTAFTRYVIAEMEKPNSAFMERGKCKAAKPWKGHKGFYAP